MNEVEYIYHMPPVAAGGHYRILHSSPLCLNTNFRVSLNITATFNLFSSPTMISVSCLLIYLSIIVTEIYLSSSFRADPLREELDMELEGKKLTQEDSLM